MHRSLQRMVRSTWTDSGMRSATLRSNSHSVSSGIVKHFQDVRGFGPPFEPPCPTSLPQASAVVSKTSWVRMSGGAYFRLPLCWGCCSRSRLSSTAVASYRCSWGEAETFSRPRRDSLSTKAVTSRSACTGSTSNSVQMRPTRELTGVLPSAPSQISVPTALRVFRVLSSARRITASPSYTRQAVRELRARYCSGTIDHLPEAGIETKGEVEARGRLDELARDIEHARRQLRVSGEEEDIREKPLERALWRDRFDGMSTAMVEKVDSPERGGPILPRARKLAPERGAVTACALVGEPHDGELVAQQRRVGREPRERRLAGPRGTGEEMRPPVPDEARRVHDQPVNIDERERVQDSQEAVDR